MPERPSSKTFPARRAQKELRRQARAIRQDVADPRKRSDPASIESPSQRHHDPGRRKGQINYRTMALLEWMQTHQKDTPVQFLIKVYTDRKRTWQERIEAARAAAPYIHPRLNAIDLRVSGTDERQLVRLPAKAASIDDWSELVSNVLEGEVDNGNDEK